MVGNCINGTNAGLHADLSLYSLYPLHARDCSSTKKLKALLRLIVLGNEVVTKYLVSGAHETLPGQSYRPLPLTGAGRETTL